MFTAFFKNRLFSFKRINIHLFVNSISQNETNQKFQLYKVTKIIQKITEQKKNIQLYNMYLEKQKLTKTFKTCCISI